MMLISRNDGCSMMLYIRGEEQRYAMVGDMRNVQERIGGSEAGR